MDKSHRDLLLRQRSKLMENISTKYGLLDDLVTHGVLLPVHHDTIKALSTEEERVTELLDLLPRRGPDAFEKFCESLVKNGQDFVVNMFLRTRPTGKASIYEKTKQGIILETRRTTGEEARGAKCGVINPTIMHVNTNQVMREYCGEKFGAMRLNPPDKIGLNARQKEKRCFLAVLSGYVTPKAKSRHEQLVESTLLDSVYTAPLGRWDFEGAFERQGPVPEGKRSASTVALPNKIIVAGGKNKSYHVTKSVYSLYPGTMAWHREPDMMTGRANFTLSVIMCEGGPGLLAAGGLGHSDIELDSCELLLPCAESWIPSTRLPQSLYSHAATNPDLSTVYLTGGGSSKTVQYKGTGIRYINETKIEKENATRCFQTVTGVWKSKAHMVESRMGHCMFSVNQNIYAFGGHELESSNMAEQYNLLTDQWTILSNIKLPCAHNTSFTCVTNNDLVILLQVEAKHKLDWLEMNSGPKSAIALFEPSQYTCALSQQELPWQVLQEACICLVTTW